VSVLRRAVHAPRHAYRHLVLERGLPPIPRPGSAVGPPDFVGIGVQKAGTSWWYGLIAAHPDVARPVAKELHYFTRIRPTPADGAFDAEQDRRRYARFFPRRPGQIAGECLARLAAAAPTAKILITLRDPITRLVSQRTMRLRRGQPERGTFELVKGNYASQLERVYQVFPRDRVLVLQFEQMVRDPGRELLRTYEFLGLDPSFVPEYLTVPVNAARRDNAALTPAERAELVAVYRPELVRLAAMQLDLDLSLWPTAVEAIAN
jgi:hypothetical protein